MILSWTYGNVAGQQVAITETHGRHVAQSASAQFIDSWIRFGTPRAQLVASLREIRQRDLFAINDSQPAKNIGYAYFGRRPQSDGWLYECIVAFTDPGKQATRHVLIFRLLSVPMT